MSSRIELIFQKFLRRACSRAMANTKIQLLQVLTSGATNLLREVPLDAEYGYEDERINTMCAEFLSNAQEDADGHRGLTTYCLTAFKGVTRSERSPLIRLRSQDADFESGEALGESEPASKEGLLAQLMRHLEVKDRMLAQLVEVTTTQSTAIIARLSETNRHYEDRHWENLIRTEELASEKETRELDRMRAISQEKRKDQMLATLKPMIPIAIAKFKGTPSDAKPELWKESIKMILKDVTPEKMTQLAELIGPHSLALAEIWMDAHKEADSELPETSGASDTH